MRRLQTQIVDCGDLNHGVEMGGFQFAGGDSPWPTVPVHIEVVPYDEKRGVATFFDRDSWLRLEVRAMTGMSS
jgi:hypothetical protein